MAASSVDTFVFAFSDPKLDSSETQRVRLSANISFELYDDDNIRTLSSNTVSNGADIEGLLYVPDLDPSDACTDTSQSYIPNNATRKADLPDQQYLYIAFAPWISAPCTKSYLAAAKGSTAFMTYLPDDGVVTPPLVNSNVWDLHDGGQWKAQNKFPVYAIPGAEGAAIMRQMGQYSGNSSDSRIADLLKSEQLDLSDSVRLYASFGTSETSHLPTLWAFLLIILGLILFVVGATSLLMHWIQRRRRRDLQRRVERGEVDLETLGLKRSRITQEAIDSLPISTYTQRIEVIVEPRTEHSSGISCVQAEVDPSAPSHTQWSQPTCPICLEDFILDVTIIRTLPCHHVYHPECIDPFLRENSALCPVCKAAVLPAFSKSHVAEPITNVMVRHERRVRQMRQRHEAGGLSNREASAQGAEGRRWYASVTHLLGRRAVSDPVSNPMTSTSNQMEMLAIERRAVSGPVVAGADLEETAGPSRLPADGGSRTGQTRMRFGILRGHESLLLDEELATSARRSRWRKAITAVFPGFR